MILGLSLAGTSLAAPTNSAKRADAASPAAAAAPAHKWASSLPSAAPVRHGIVTLAYDELSRHVGERILITTVYGDLRDIVIETYGAQELLVRARVVGGYATQHIARDQIRTIRDPD
jgi:hypothetical protein